MKKIVCFHLYNDFSGSPKVLKVVLEGLLQRGCAVDLVTSRGGVLDNAQCIIHNFIAKGSKTFGSQLTPSATLVPLRQGDNIEGQQTTNNRQQLADNSQLSILSPKAQRPSVLNSQLKYRYYDYRFSGSGVVTALRYVLVQMYTFFLALGYWRDRDVVFYVNTILPVGPAVAGWLMRKRVVYHYHENAMVKSGLYRVLAWVMQRVATEIVCVSEYQRSFLKREKGVVVVPNALPEEFVERAVVDSEGAFERKRVLMLGSLKGYKGTNEFVELARRLGQYEFVLVLNEEQENIDAYIEKNGLQVKQNLRIYARQTDVVPFYAEASVVLNLSNKNLFIETFGLTALEAMVFGLPVVVPTVGGIAEMVEDGVNGYKVDVQELDEIAKRIDEMLSDRELYVRLSEGAVEQAKRYSAREMVDRMNEELGMRS